MEKENYFSQRLKKERERLGMSQDEAASLVGVSREMWGKYERGAADPAVSKVIDFGKSGADVAYILTGVRSQSIESTLTQREQGVLEHYRQTNDEGQRHIEQAALFAAESAQKVKRKKQA